MPVQKKCRGERYEEREAMVIGFDDEMGQGESGKSSKVEPQPIKRLSWSLVEQESLTQDVKEYRRRKALLEALVDIRAGQRSLSRRVINI